MIKDVEIFNTNYLDLDYFEFLIKKYDDVDILLVQTPQNFKEQSYIDDYNRLVKMLTSELNFTSRGIDYKEKFGVKLMFSLFEKRKNKDSKVRKVFMVVHGGRKQ